MMAAFSNMLVSLGCHARESGHPVISNSATLAMSPRILDHPLSRVMTAAELSDSVPLLINVYASDMKSEIRDGMKIDWDAPIAMDDGVVLRADVFRPVADGKYPVILSYGPYAKGLSMQEGYKSAWLRIIKAAPDVLEGSSNTYQNWELFDPEKWVPDGYICVRVDSRGAGRSPGFLETWSPRESKDIAACVDWAGVQPWSNGKVGLHGISYYSMN